MAGTHENPPGYKVSLPTPSPVGQPSGPPSLLHDAALIILSSTDDPTRFWQPIGRDTIILSIIGTTEQLKRFLLLPPHSAPPCMNGVLLACVLGQDCLTAQQVSTSPMLMMVVSEGSVIRPSSKATRGAYGNGDSSSRTFRAHSVNAQSWMLRLTIDRHRILNMLHGNGPAFRRIWLALFNTRLESPPVPDARAHGSGTATPWRRRH